MSELLRGGVEFTHSAGYVLRLPASEAPAPLLVVLHGQGMSGEQMLRLLGLQGTVRFLLAGDGPYPFEKRKGTSIEIGHGWYLYRGDQEEFRRQLELSESHVLRLVEEACERHRVDRGRIGIVGYSQGGYLAGFIALRHRHLFRALIVMSSRLKHEFLRDQLSAGDLPATLFIHSVEDPAVRWESTHDGRELLVRGGADVQVHLHREGHRIPQGAGTTIERWLDSHGM